MLQRRFHVAAGPRIRVVVASAGLACCSIELEAAVHAGLLVPEADPGGEAPTPDDTVLVVAGTITNALAPSVEALLSQLPAGTKVMAFGACAISGGPYWDSPVVEQGLPALHIDAVNYVPGCPPRPAQLVDALVALAGARA